MFLLDLIGFILYIIVALATCIAPIPLVLGILKYIFFEDDRKFALQMILHAVIVLIIGFGTCTMVDLNYFI